MTSTAAPLPGPAARSMPALGAVLRAEHRLILRTIATRGRLLAIGALAALNLLSVLVLSGTSTDDPLRRAVGFADDGLSTLLPVAVLVFGAAALGDLLDDGSLVYLWLRPVPVAVHVLAAWLATLTIAIPLVVAPTIVAIVVLDSSPEMITGALLAGAVAAMAYSAIFVAAGVRIRRSLPWGLVYILIWEGFVASAGETATRVAIRSYVRSILSDQTGVALKLGEFSTAVGVLVPLAVGALALAYTTRRLARTDVP